MSTNILLLAGFLGTWFGYFIILLSSWRKDFGQVDDLGFITALFCSGALGVCFPISGIVLLLFLLVRKVNPDSVIESLDRYIERISRSRS